ncbi:Proteasome formation inhibitor PI31 [Handroanthus impetiginosus]|uniref:Proteasome formation inhibitor PI31 n=1 Tax=Handroanthus impetiginosus TaxID=429701 RepID=A0A2G9GLC0_9LAMI|nr:Proteasome formation inhibitor PI31 [Handroanthus impetiginosus]
MSTEQSIMAVIRAARPSFRSRHDRVAFAIHAAFLSAGYVLNSTGAAAFSDDALSASSSADEVGIDNWNEVEDNYAFVYSHPEKGSKKVLVKSLVMNDKLLVDALLEGDSQPLHLEVNVGEYVEDNGGMNYGSQFKNMRKLVADVNDKILDMLEISCYILFGSKKISRDDRDRPSIGVVHAEDPHISPPTSGFVVPPIPPKPPPLEKAPGPRPYIATRSSNFCCFLHSMNVANFERDHYFNCPLGDFKLFVFFLIMNTSIHCYTFVPNFCRGDFGGGSMLVGPQDPRFFGGRSGEPGLPGGQPGVPRGARFDPYGPPGLPGSEPGHFVRNPRRRGGGTHPDLHHFHDGSDFI